MGAGGEEILGVDICEVIQFHSTYFLESMEITSLEISYKGKRFIFLVFYKIYLIFFEI